MIFVRHILEDTRRRLAVLNRTATLADAAKILANPTTPLVIVCDDEGRAVGVISKTDIVKAFSVAHRSSGGASTDVSGMSAEAIMTKDVLSCEVDQTLESVLTNLNARSLRCTPVLDSSRRPQGVVHARDIARAVLDEVASEESLLRDYVLGIGYQ